MNEPWQIRVFEKTALVYMTQLTGPVELGRQSEGEGGPYFQKREDDRWRIIVARLDENVVSRRHVLAEPLPDGRVRIRNLSAKMPIVMEGSRIEPEDCADVNVPAVLMMASRTIQIAVPEEEPYHSLASALTPSSDATPTVNLVALGLTPFGAPPSTGSTNFDMEALVRWLHALLGVLQTASCVTDFYERAARVLVELIGLDAGRVLLYEDGGWKTRGLHVVGHLREGAVWRPSQSVLNRLLRDKQVIWNDPGPQVIDERSTQTILALSAVVAAPVLDSRGVVIGAVYGDRGKATTGLTPPISRLEAMFVELVAGGLAAGLARIGREQATLRKRVVYEQFFSAEQAAQLVAHPDLLVRRDAEVSLLFCGIRDFSRLSAKLDPGRALEWASHVLEVVSECVIAQQGVLVDFVGDELLALWGAPGQQTEPATRACRAALAMIERLPELNSVWQPILGEPMLLGIGIHTGQARVGNAGTSRKFKYGPIGTTVRLARRVQAATKAFKVPILLTGTTISQLSPGLDTRRICRALGADTEPALELHELCATADECWPDWRRDYENALGQFEQGDYAEAARLLGELITRHPYDGPALVLLARSVDAMLQNYGQSLDVWRLPEH